VNKKKRVNKKGFWKIKKKEELKNNNINLNIQIK
jgi:hypothetical protein